MIFREPRDCFKDLVQRRVIAAHPPPVPLRGGNADRQDCYSAWRAHRPDGSPAHLLVGRRLANRAAQHAAFNRACPDLIPSIYDYVVVGELEVVCSEFIEGLNLDAPECLSTHGAAGLQCGFLLTLRQLATTEVSSTETARLNEWNNWATALARQPFFTPSERRLLEATILPRLYQRLVRGREPRLRWTNGDFTAANLLLSSSGQPRLIDLEFATQSHFTAEEAVRFAIFSRVARVHPGWFSALRDPGPAWHLYFWLRQTSLESEKNSGRYLDQIRPRRLAVIRRLAEGVLEADLAGWSEPAAPVHFHLETGGARNVESPGEIAGWCHVPNHELRAIGLTGDRGTIVETAPLSRPDVQAHFAGSASSLRTGFRLQGTVHDANNPPRWLTASLDDGTMLPFHSVPASTYDGLATGLAPTPVERLQRFEQAHWPLISVVMPVHNPPLRFLQCAVASVMEQAYPNWELHLVDDASTDCDIIASLRNLPVQDHRIRVHHLAANAGISAATNVGITHAAGTFVAFVDHDDELAPDALLQVAIHLLENPHEDVLYTDQDKCDDAGRHSQPFRKPPWSPVYFLGVMYVGHLLVARTSLVQAVGGCLSRYDRVQDFELMLRLSERTRNIGHLPKILYHWRTHGNSIAQSSEAKGPIESLQVDAVEAHLARRNIPLRPVAHPTIPHRVQLFPGTSETAHVSIVIRAGSNPDVLRRCLDSVYSRTSHTAFDVWVEPDNTKSESWRSASPHPVRFLSPSIESGDTTSQTLEINGDFFVYLDARAEILTPDWLQLLLGHLRLPSVGCAGPLLIASDGRISHAGLSLGASIGNNDTLQGYDPTRDDPAGALLVAREVAALLPACLMISRSLFGKTGIGFPIAKSDLFSRIASQGLSTICVPAVLVRFPQSH